MINYTTTKLLCFLCSIFIFTACNDSDDPSDDNKDSCSLSIENTSSKIIQISDEAIDLTINVKASGFWRITNNAEWITLSQDTGGANTAGKDVTFTVSKNTTTNSRITDITIRSGTANDTITIKQDGRNTPEEDQTWEFAHSAVKNMRVGWNLGNTLDSKDSGNQWIKKSTPGEPYNYETAWGQPYTTIEMIRMFKDAGFGAIRVPVTWVDHLDEDNNINEKWIARVEEVVNYVLDCGLYCIINVHHDTGADESADLANDNPGRVTWLKADINQYPTASIKYKKLWQQIATRFEKYDKHLLFESYNEILDANNSWDAPKSNSGYEAANKLNQDFVNTVRQTGGNNAKRNLIVNTYSASTVANTINNMIIPSDDAVNHLIAQVHLYAPYNLCLANKNESYSQSTFDAGDEAEIEAAMKRVYDRFSPINIPVIIGEYGAIEDKNNMDARARCAGFYIKTANKYDMVCFYWRDLLDRKNLVWNEAEIKDAIIANARK